MGCTLSRSGVEAQGGIDSGYAQLTRSRSMPTQPRNAKENFFRNRKNESHHLVALTSSTYGSLRIESLPHLDEGRISMCTSTSADEIHQKIKSSMDLPAVVAPNEPWSEVIKSLPKIPRQEDREAAKLLREGGFVKPETINMWELMEGLEEDNPTAKYGALVARRISEQGRGKVAPFEKCRNFTTIHTVEDLDGVDVTKSVPSDYSKRGSSLETVISLRKSHELRASSQELNRTPVVQLRRRSLPMENPLEAPGLGSVSRKGTSHSQELFKPSMSKPKPVAHSTHESCGLSTRPLDNLHTGTKIAERKVSMEKPTPVLRSPHLRASTGHERVRLPPSQESPSSRSFSGKSTLEEKKSLFSLDATPLTDVSSSQSNKHSTGSLSVPKASMSRSAIPSREGATPKVAHRQIINGKSKTDVTSSESNRQLSPLPKIVMSRSELSSQGGPRTTAPKTNIGGTKPKFDVTLGSKKLPAECLASSKSVVRTSAVLFAELAKAPVSVEKSLDATSKSDVIMSARPSSAPKMVTSKVAGASQEGLTSAVNKQTIKAPVPGQQNTTRRTSSVAPRIALAIAALSNRGGSKSPTLKQPAPKSGVTTSENSRHPSGQSIPGPRVVVSDAVPSDLYKLSPSTNMLTSKVSTTMENAGGPTTQASKSEVSAAHLRIQEGMQGPPSQQGKGYSCSSKIASGDHEGELIVTESQNSSVSLSSTSTTALQGSEPATTGSRGRMQADPISSGYEHVLHTEIADVPAIKDKLCSRGSIGNSKSQSSFDENTCWSLDSVNPPFDPELLASFEEALDLFSADDWYNVHSNDVAINSGSSSDVDSPPWANEVSSPVGSVPFAGDSNIKGNKIMANHTEQQALPQGSAKKVFSPKIAHVDMEETKVNDDPLNKFEKKCPPGGEDRIVLYTTSLRGIRKTFEDCGNARMILQGLNVSIDERDVAMHAGFRQELKNLMGKPTPVPRLFIKGRYIGGAEEVSHLHEEGILVTFIEDLPTQISRAPCDGCGGVTFVPCSECSGSRKVITDDNEVAVCSACNENGLIRCPICR